LVIGCGYRDGLLIGVVYEICVGVMGVRWEILGIDRDYMGDRGYSG
jgi:hypothetical protein